MKKEKSNKPRKKAVAKRKVKAKLITKSKEPVSPIHNTSGGEMPNAATRKRPRKDVRIGFR